ncbi:MAG: helix-turn-helix domain-containing protein [Planctomycetaceae bacterium]
MTSRTRIHRPRQQTAAQAAAGRAKRAKFQLEKPSLKQLLASGDYSEPVTQAEYWDLRKAIVCLKGFREAAGLSLADVAERTGIDRAAICRLENGTHENPTISTLNRYAEALGRRISFRVVDVGG